MSLKSIRAAAGLGLLALILAACGQVPTQTWPGLATDGQTAYLSQGHQVYAVDLGGFTQDWVFPQQANNNIGAFVSDPVLGDGVLVVGSEGPAGQYSGTLFGLDLATGVQRWCLAFDQKGAGRLGCPLAQGAPATGPLGLSAAVDSRIVGGISLVDGIAYLGLASGKVYAVDTATGRDQWFFEAERDVWAAPLVAEDLVYVASLDHRVYALDRQDGSEVWTRDMGAAVAGTPSLQDGTLYVGTFGNRLVALDAASGEARWYFAAQNWVWSGPAVEDGTLYFTDVSGNVYAVDAATGQPVWQVKPGGQMRARPAIAGDVLFIGDGSGNLFALNRADGTTRWNQTVSGQLLSSPVLTEAHVLVAPFSGDNLLMAFTKAGALDRAFNPSEE